MFADRGLQSTRSRADELVGGDAVLVRVAGQGAVLLIEVVLRRTRVLPTVRKAPEKHSETSALSSDWRRRRRESHTTTSSSLSHALYHNRQSL